MINVDNKFINILNRIYFNIYHTQLFIQLLSNRFWYYYIACEVGNYYVFHGRVTLFFANNFLTQRQITMKFLHNFI